MNDFIAKPIDVDQMLTAIVRQLPTALAGIPAATMQKATVLPAKLQQKPGKAFDAGPLFELSKDNPAYRSTLLGLIGNVVERGPVQFNEARLAWNEGRIDEAARILHTLRGSVGTLGAARFAAAALELETALRTERDGPIASLFETAQQELDETVGAARTWLEQVKPQA